MVRDWLLTRFISHLLKCIWPIFFLNAPPKSPEYSDRNLVTVVIISIGGLLSWLVSSSSSVPELTCQGVGKGCPSKSLGEEGTAKAQCGKLVSLME